LSFIGIKSTFFLFIQCTPLSHQTNANITFAIYYQYSAFVPSILLNFCSNIRTTSSLSSFLYSNLVKRYVSRIRTNLLNSLWLSTWTSYRHAMPSGKEVEFKCNKTAQKNESILRNCRLSRTHTHGGELRCSITLRVITKWIQQNNNNNFPCRLFELSSHSIIL
jgi:hypothetical protein